MMRLKLPSGVASTQDLTALLLEMREYVSWFAHESIKKRVDVKHTSESPTMSTNALELLREWKAKQQITQQSLDLLVKTLEEYTKTAPSITVTLAATPTSSLRTNLVTWFRENIAPDILVNFRFNATLLGGMVISYGSRVFDWSFRRQILASRKNFPGVLRRV